MKLQGDYMMSKSEICLINPLRENKNKCLKMSVVHNSTGIMNIK